MARDLCLLSFWNEEIGRDKTQRDRTIYLAHATYGYTLRKIAGHLRVHYTTVSKIMNRDKQN